MQLQGLTGIQVPTTELTEATREGGRPPKKADGSIHSWPFNTQRFKTNSTSSSHSCSGGKSTNHQFTTCQLNQLQASTPRPPWHECEVHPALCNMERWKRTLSSMISQPTGVLINTKCSNSSQCSALPTFPTPVPRCTLAQQCFTKAGSP